MSYQKATKVQTLMLRKIGFTDDKKEITYADDLAIDEQFNRILIAILLNYKPDIFNCDETTLYYRAIPGGKIAEKIY